mmetsp:Transcript_56472/g.61121  ORF Transcript_56472/g.61121 Transcript_56472/m.61121 type:complete len:149 (-) Transcript_56472:45-491(-)
MELRSKLILNIIAKTVLKSSYGRISSHTTYLKQIVVSLMMAIIIEVNDHGNFHLRYLRMMTCLFSLSLSYKYGKDLVTIEKVTEAIATEMTVSSLFSLLSPKKRRKDKTNIRDRQMKKSVEKLLLLLLSPVGHLRRMIVVGNICDNTD